MTIKSSGPLAFSDINEEIVNRQTGQISFETDKVRALKSTNFTPASQISFLDLYGKTQRIPNVRDIITSSTNNYTSKFPNAELVEFWVVGGGGAGGAAGANDPFWNSGVAAAGGGGSGGTGYGRISGADFAYYGPWTITIGAGGAGVTASQGRYGIGSNGGVTSFLSPTRTNGYGYGGGGGGGASYWSPGNDTASASGGGGGSGDGRGSGYSDIFGGPGGSAYVSSSGLTWSAGGGGCISMDRKRVTSYSGQSVSGGGGQFGAGAQGINIAVPTSLASYRNDTNAFYLWPNVAPVVYGGNGGSGTGGNGSFGGGGGGGAERNARGGNGGAGFVYIIYTPASEMISYDNSNGGPYSRPPY